MSQKIETRNTEVAVQVQENIEDIFNVDENLENIDVVIPNIKVLGKLPMFSSDGIAEPFKKFTGIIIYKQTINAYWKDVYSGSHEPPSCFSPDGIAPTSGDDRQSTKCAYCIQNKFKSSKVPGSTGKACSNKRVIHVIVKGSEMPYKLSIASASIKSFDSYMSTLANKKIPYPRAVTEFSLEAKKNSGGIEYSEMKFTLLKDIKDDEDALNQAIKIRDIILKWKPMILKTSTPNSYNSEYEEQPEEEDINV